MRVCLSQILQRNEILWEVWMHSKVDTHTTLHLGPNVSELRWLSNGVEKNSTSNPGDQTLFQTLPQHWVPTVADQVSIPDWMPLRRCFEFCRSLVFPWAIRDRSRPVLWAGRAEITHRARRLLSEKWVFPVALHSNSKNTPALPLPRPIWTPKDTCLLRLKLLHCPRLSL